MSVKKKLGMGIAGAVLSVGLISGGTFAYFSDSAERESHLTSGTIDLGFEPTPIFMNKLQPGDTEEKEFKVSNNGSLDMQLVDLMTDYTVRKNGDTVGKKLADEYAEQIYVKLKGTNVETNLKDLKGANLQDPINSYIEDIDSGDTETFTVQFRFNDTGDKQNDLQNLKLDLTWKLEAQQTDGEEK